MRRFSLQEVRFGQGRGNKPALTVASPAKTRYSIIMFMIIIIIIISSSSSSTTTIN